LTNLTASEALRGFIEATVPDDESISTQRPNEHSETNHHRKENTGRRREFDRS
jgi:hypothetical protein